MASLNKGLPLVHHCFYKQGQGVNPQVQTERYFSLMVEVMDHFDGTCLNAGVIFAFCLHELLELQLDMMGMGDMGKK